ncbi:unnamed protein product [Amoebophrya sp. A120]|nr:unnamed protein product [Amoebophrya sp. A120]|eukprot:GSA120T00011300001.1
MSGWPHKKKEAETMKTVAAKDAPQRLGISVLAVTG